MSEIEEHEFVAHPLHKKTCIKCGKFKTDKIHTKKEK